MSETATFMSAFAVGLLGAVHCIGMCGGIAGVLSIGTEKLTATSQFLRTLAYNTGRIVSYTGAGIVAGLAGETLGGLLPAGTARPLAMGISAAFALLLALYLVGRGGPLIRLEGLGGRLWQHLKPFGQRFIPARNLKQAFGLGLVWGWLPCGLVYTALAWALVSGSAVRGAVLMLGFGLGTLPALVGMGMAGSRLLAWRERPLIRYTAGLVLVGFAASALWHGLTPGESGMSHVH
ncbi:MAG: sulfite exporter TauE/SafE family protein [Gammaproteobacteria bacterium]|nr:sulfite exporter TauE/SafE family protein [Gammaproteobacteria bacterium]